MKWAITLIVILISSVYSPVSATVIKVPGDYPTIQAGLLAAVGGDTVLVAEGIYYENITWPATNGIKLISERGKEHTIIDGNQQGSVIRFSLGMNIDSTTVISGFSITNGYAQGIDPKDDGGGIYLLSSSPSLVNLIISGNTAIDEGGGIYFGSNSKPNLNSVTISGNKADDGGGIFCDNSNPSFVNVTISVNTAGEGGGIYLGNYSTPILENSVISNNVAYRTGGGIYCKESSPILENITLSTNTADYSNYDGKGGGGIYCYNSDITLISSSIIQNKTLNGIYAHGAGISCKYSYLSLLNVNISGNTADAIGGGIYCQNSSLDLVNVTITGNNANSGGAITCSDYSRPNLVNSILWNNTPHEIIIYSGTLNAFYSDVQGGWEGEGNIDADPLFVGNGDFRLQEGSPCIDAGIAFFVWGSDTLIDISPEEYVGSAPDIGAYEFGVYPQISLSSDNIVFDSTAVASTDIEPLTIYNLGKGVLTIDSMYTSNPVFQINSVPQSIASMDSEIVKISFTPGDSGVVNGLLTILCNDINNPTVNVTLTGVGLVTDVSDHNLSAIPEQFQLYQNYPNPFNPETNIQYELPKTSQVKLVIYNLAGQRVATLVDEQQPAGFYSVKWNGKDDAGRNAASGVYLYRLETKEFVQVKKLVLVR